jgi:DNA-binding protein HU-beta
MRKRELAQAVASHTDVDPKVAAKVIDGTLEVILATVAKGEDVALAGFAKFSKVRRPARMARNPATGAAVKVKAKTVAKIVPLKGFKDVVLGAAPAPKLTKAKATTTKKAVAGASPTKTTRPAAAAKTTTSSATTARAKAVTTAPAPRVTRSG